MKKIDIAALRKVAQTLHKALETSTLFEIVDEKEGDPHLKIVPEALPKVCTLLHQHPDLLFDYLSCITGVDLSAQGKMAVIYHLASLPNEQMVTLKVVLENSASPEVPTISDIWQNANWLERETYDLFGIHFDGHPDLRRILLPADWKGFPLLKSYKTQDYYHGVKVDY